MRSHFVLDPAITFLNHGSFGACPRVVLEHQQELRARLEAEPVRFFMRELEPLAAAARSAIARFIHCQADDLALLTNATTAVNCVLSSLELEPGDELLTTDHAYNACANVLRVKAARTKAKVVIAKVPFPHPTQAAFERAVLEAVTPKTKLVLLDHITSPTAIVFSMERVVQTLEARSVMVLVDAAHAPGMVPLEVDTLGASFHTGNLHKWVCAPKGAAYLHVRKDRQPLIRPLVISHGANSTRTDVSRFRWSSTGSARLTRRRCSLRGLRLRRWGKCGRTAGSRFVARTASSF